MTEEYIRSELLRLLKEEQIHYNQEGMARIESFLLDLIPPPPLDYDVSVDEIGNLSVTFFPNKFIFSVDIRKS